MALFPLLMYLCAGTDARLLPSIVRDTSIERCRASVVRGAYLGDRE